jgi:signal transduction histidine kinase
MLTTLMDITEAESGVMQLNREPTSVCGLLDNVIELYQLVAEEKQVSVVTKFERPCVAVIDATRIRQVFANLLDNALKYTDAGGRVSVECRVQGTKVLTKFTDSGVGISEDEQPRIWSRLYRGDKSRSQRGLGLGLSLVKAIVEAHRGEVFVQSATGKGSIFTVTLPLE